MIMIENHIPCEGLGSSLDGFSHSFVMAFLNKSIISTTNKKHQAVALPYPVYFHIGVLSLSV